MSNNDLPTPPFLHIEGISNFRDLGGYPLTHSSAQSVRRGLIYRSAFPYRITPSGKRSLQTLQISTIFDFRSKNEAENSKVMGAPSVLDDLQPKPEYKFTPVFPDVDASPEALAIRYRDYAHGGSAGFVRAYRDILESGVPAYKLVFEHLRDRPGEAILFHCSAGKDRTGVFGALILKLAGCGDEVVAGEYELTTRGMEAGESPMRGWIVQHLLDSVALKGDREAAIRMTGSTFEAMVETLKMIQEVYGGVEAYLTGKCGFSKEDLEKIRGNIVVDEAPILGSVL